MRCTFFFWLRIAPFIFLFFSPALPAARNYICFKTVFRSAVRIAEDSGNGKTKTKKNMSANTTTVCAAPLPSLRQGRPTTLPIFCHRKGKIRFNCTLPVSRSLLTQSLHRNLPKLPLGFGPPPYVACVRCFTGLS